VYGCKGSGVPDCRDERNQGFRVSDLGFRVQGVGFRYLAVGTRGAVISVEHR
jgi:hypothetical protein